MNNNLKTQTRVFADPSSDFVFKRIMSNPIVAIDIINTFIPELHVKKVSYLPTVMNKVTVDGRTTIVDVLAEDQDKNLFIIEMQRSAHRFFMERTVVYASRAIGYYKMVKQNNNLNDKQDSKLNYNIKGTYVIAFVHHNIKALGLSDDFNAPIANFYTTNPETGSKLSGAPEYHFILLANVPNYLENLSADKKKWLYLLCSSADMTDVPSEYENDEPAQAYFFESCLANYSADELLQYQASMDTILDIENAIIEAEIRGEAKGKEEGKAEGLAEGEAKGKAEAKVEMARALKQQGVALETIAIASGLSVDDITKL